MSVDVDTKTVTVLCEHLPDTDRKILSCHSTTLADLDLDSLVILEVIYQLEEHFEIILDDVQLQNVACIADLVKAFTANADEKP